MTPQIDKLPPPPEGEFKAYPQLVWSTVQQTTGPKRKPLRDPIESSLFMLICAAVALGLVILLVALWLSIMPRDSSAAESNSITFNVVQENDIIQFLDFVGLTRIGDIEKPAVICGPVLKPLGVFHDRLGRASDHGLCYDPNGEPTVEQTRELCESWSLEWIAWAWPMLTCSRRGGPT